jgi:pyrroline-5-carboxylate reductase
MKTINLKIAFIGGGNMGEAMLAAILKKKLSAPAGISVSDISASRRRYLTGKYGIAVTGSNRAAVRDKDIIVLAVKPQQLLEVLGDLKGQVKAPQLVLSIAAGVKIAAISRGLGHEKIVRVMPNTPAQIGFGMSGWTATTAVSRTQKAQARALLAAMGKEIFFRDESTLDIVTAVSGSGPAYFYLFAEALIEAAVNAGLSRENAGELVSQTMLGAAQLVSKSGRTPAELRQAVTSRGGTTERALKTFEDGDLAGLVEKAVSAAYRRARELGERT